MGKVPGNQLGFSFEEPPQAVAPRVRVTGAPTLFECPPDDVTSWPLPELLKFQIARDMDSLAHVDDDYLDPFHREFYIERIAAYRAWYTSLSA